MTIGRSFNKVWVLGLSLAIFLIPALSAYADTSASGSALNIRLKIGSKTMTVNGQAVAVQAPYQKNGATYVPLSVVTKGLGATLQLKDNRMITLKQSGHTVVLTIGSKSATADGKAFALPVAPVVINGLTMIPIRAVEAFGAKVTYAAATKEIVVTAQASAASSAGTGGIDTDAGKSLIGDSYFQWSMNYPTGLVQNYQSSSGDQLVFEDVKQDYYLEIDVEAAAEPMDASDQLDYLKDYLGEETIVDMKPVVRSGVTFQRIVSKTKDGYYYEYRGLQANGYMYTLIFGKKAVSAADLSASSNILDSFQPKFDASNASLKDLTKIKDGYVTFTDEDYGLSLELPYGWHNDSYDSDSELYFYKDDSSLSVEMYSLRPNDTVEAWAGRYVQDFKDAYAEDYRTEPETSDIVWNGVPAKLVSYAFTGDKDTWYEENDILAVSGNYKFLVCLNYNRTDKEQGEKLLQRIRNGMKLDFGQVERTFGEIPDPADKTDRDALTTKSSSKYGFSVTIPKRWTASDDSDINNGYVEYEKSGLSFLVVAESGSGLETYKNLARTQYQSSGLFKLSSETQAVVGGVDGYQMVFEGVDGTEAEGSIFKIYLVENKGNIYIVQGGLAASSRTELNRKQLEDALNSFAFTQA
jgi:hypothetical protein